MAVSFPKIELKPGYESAFAKFAESLPATLADRALEELKEQLLGEHLLERGSSCVLRFGDLHGRTVFGVATLTLPQRVL